MKIFHCDHCQSLVFFENVTCLSCGNALAYVPDLGVLGSLEPAGDNLWKSPLPRAAGRTYRLCDNYTRHSVCNWAVASDDPHPLCESCRLTQVIPDLGRPGFHEGWYKLEVAKRRLVYTLLGFQLPLLNRTDDPQRGLAFEFLADAGTPVLTGHLNGVITINVAEADDAEREKRRMQMHEPYRTLLGHFRHEVAHYYWDRLIQGGPHAEGFRDLFGDERADYGESLQRHYQQGPPADWQQRFVSSYASSHPWEDWAETWAHYLHMADTLETSAACGVRLRPRRKDEPALKAVPNPFDDKPDTFDGQIDSWLSLTYVLNNLNRGLGLPDGYPFVLSVPAIEKLRFVHGVIGSREVGDVGGRAVSAGGGSAGR